MYSTMIFERPSLDNSIITEKFDLDFIYENKRTSVYGNKKVRFSFDKNVIRVLLYDGNNFELADEIEGFFDNEITDDEK